MHKNKFKTKDMMAKLLEKNPGRLARILIGSPEQGLQILVPLLKIQRWVLPMRRVSPVRTWPSLFRRGRSQCIFLTIQSFQWMILLLQNHKIQILDKKRKLMKKVSANKFKNEEKLIKFYDAII